MTRTFLLYSSYVVIYALYTHKKEDITCLLPHSRAYTLAGMLILFTIENTDRVQDT